MGLDVINSVEIYASKDSLDNYKTWSNHLKNNSSWFLKSIDLLNESIVSKYSPKFDGEDFMVINGNIVTYGELRILNTLHGMHRAPTQEDFCNGCKQFNC